MQQRGTFGPHFQQWLETKMYIPETEREALDAVIRQGESDLRSAHAEICKLQGLDPTEHNWPEWSPQANTMRWFKAIRQKFDIAAPSPS